MTAPAGLAAAIWLFASHEAWESVIFGGMIPILGALAVVWLLRWAVKENPEDDLPGYEIPEDKPPGYEEEGGPKDPAPR